MCPIEERKTKPSDTVLNKVKYFLQQSKVSEWLPPGLCERAPECQLSFTKSIAVQVVDSCRQVSAALTCEKNQGCCAYHFESQVMEFIDAWAKIEGKQDVKLCQHHTLHIHLVVHYHRLECTYTHYNIKKRSENYS